MEFASCLTTPLRPFSFDIAALALAFALLPFFAIFAAFLSRLFALALFFFSLLSSFFSAFFRLFTALVSLFNALVAAPVLAWRPISFAAPFAAFLAAFFCFFASF